MAKKTRRTRCYELDDGSIVEGGTIGTHLQMGIGDGIIPSILNTNIYDHIYIVTDEEAIDTAKKLASMEGIMCGIPAGTNVAAALKLAENSENPVIICGSLYLASWYLNQR